MSPLRPLFVGLFLLAAVVAAAALVAGPAWLEVTLPGGLPLGNLVAALLPCAAAAAALLAGRDGTWQRRWAWCALAAALAWLPLSVALAGNADLNFHGERGEQWLAMSAAMAGMVVLSLAWAAVGAIVRRARRVRGAA